MPIDVRVDSFEKQMKVKTKKQLGNEREKCGRSARENQKRYKQEETKMTKFLSHPIKQPLNKISRKIIERQNRGKIREIR